MITQQTERKAEHSVRVDDTTATSSWATDQLPAFRFAKQSTVHDEVMFDEKVEKFHMLIICKMKN